MLAWCKTILVASNKSASSKEEGAETVPAVIPESTKQLSRHDLLKAIRIIQQQPQISLTFDPMQSYTFVLPLFRPLTKEINAIANVLDVIRSHIPGPESAPRAVVGHIGDL
jgi:hypothetical protein